MSCGLTPTFRKYLFPAAPSSTFVLFWRKKIINMFLRQIYITILELTQSIPRSARFDADNGYRNVLRNVDDPPPSHLLIQQLKINTYVDTQVKLLKLRYYKVHCGMQQSSVWWMPMLLNNLPPPYFYKPPLRMDEGSETLVLLGC